METICSESSDSEGTCVLMQVVTVESLPVSGTWKRTDVG